jgi:hypothetical protein
MSTFNRKPLFAALAGLGVLGISAGPIPVLAYPYHALPANDNAWESAWTIVNTTGSPLHVHETLRSGHVAEVIDITLPPGGHVTASIVRVNGELVAPAKADEIIGDSAAATTEADANDDETLSAVKNA